VKQEKYDDNNIATVLSSWERPINLNLLPIEPALDANTNENVIYLIDYLKLFDWRGDYGNQGYMYWDPNEDRADNHWWFWPYYNVKGIKIDMRPESIMTNMHQANTSTFVALNKVTTKAKLYAIEPYMTSTVAYFGECWDNNGNPIVVNHGFAYDGWGLVVPNHFESADREGAIEQYMETYKNIFGGFYYANNGENVTVFDVKIPMTIFYEWGSFNADVTWHIDTTHGR
jgi:hypothetical protein